MKPLFLSNNYSKETPDAKVINGKEFFKAYLSLDGCLPLSHLRLTVRGDRLPFMKYKLRVMEFLIFAVR